MQIFRKEKEMSRIEIEKLRTGMYTILTQFERDTALSENTAFFTVSRNVQKNVRPQERN